MLVNESTLNAIFTGFNTRFQSAFGSAPIFADRLATEVPTMGSSETHAFLASIPRMREWLGDKTIQNAGAYGFNVVNKDFELTLEVDRNKIEDDSLGVYNPIVDQMGVSARKLYDDLLVDELRNGHARLCYDGQYLFDTDHPISKLDPSISGTQANYAASGVALTLDNYVAKRAVMMAFKGDNNKELGIVPDTLIVPPQLENTARLIVEAENVINTTGATPGAGAANQTNVMRGTAKVIVIPELAADATTWYLADMSKPMRPFVKQVRRAASFVALDDPRAPNVFWRKQFVFGAEARGNIGRGLWFLISKWVA